MVKIYFNARDLGFYTFDDSLLESSTLEVDQQSLASLESQRAASGLVQITPELHASLLAQIGYDKILAANVDGSPKLINREDMPAERHKCTWDPVAFVFVPLPFDAERDWGEIRLRRNRLLQRSDWTDTLSAQARLGPELFGAWQVYRQALRDITNQAYPPTWPAKPAAA